MIEDASRLVDAGNHLLAAGECMLFTGLATTPAGQRMVMTIRTPSTTLTLFLDESEAGTWGRQITRDAARMSKTGLIVAGPVTTPNGGPAA